MKINISKKLSKVTILEGFPGFGLIGTISIEFLLDHLKTEKVGTIEMPEIPAMTAIHNNEIIEPISLHYCKDYNLLLIHAINIGKDLGWKLSEAILELAKLTQAKEIISLEGVGSPNTTTSRVFYFAKGNSTKAAKKLQQVANPLMEGIIVGATGALLAKETKMPFMALFAEAKSNMPDSTAAAAIIEALDAYLGLEVDPSPLKKQAVEFENKLKDIVKKGKKATKVQEAKLSYVG